MQSCLEYHHQQHHHHHPQGGSPHVTFRQFSPHSSSPPHSIKEEEPSGALTTASPASGSGGGPAVSSGGGGGFCGSQHCYLPASKKVDSLPRLGMLGGSTPGMYSKALIFPDSHSKAYGLPSSTNAGPLSPSNLAAHWVSMMSAEQAQPNPHDVHYWNGSESKMNTFDPLNASSMHKGPGGSLEEGRGGGGMDSSQMHSLYGTHGNRANSTSSGSPPVSTPSSSGSMLVVPQPISAATKGPGAPSGVATNGTGRKYQCKMCPQIFLHKSAMQHHAREIHRGEVKPHQCQQCLKSFSSNHQLTQHIRIHTGEKPYKCSYCDRRFKQLSHVQQHTRLHTGERPYKCHLPECGRAFIQLSNLQQHLRNHDSQMERAKNRPFHCNICGKGFASESSLRTHRSKQHAALIGGANSQSCPVCHKICLNAEALMDHMRTAHKDPNASGTPSKRKRGRTRFRTETIITSTSNSIIGHTSTPGSANYPSSPSTSPGPHPNTSIAMSAASFGSSLTSTTATLMSQMGISMGPFVVPQVVGSHHPGHSLSSHHLNHPQNHFAHHPLAGRTQPSFLNL
ncbi:zinc finger protein 362 isoform X4 [Parasteatoda tepidariorum]|uniref:zinc finger protein 362 isoform X4 n=1 Tax=Parasteatoda tepidariorum TaxID=114398 RepID=UPI001C71CBA0|nr:zinc finger protein 362 isoform X3 [Parasteatoda tepidariorum]